MAKRIDLGKVIPDQKDMNILEGDNITISNDGTNITISAKDTTYEKASEIKDGLMSKEDYKKINDISTNISDLTNQVNEVKEDTGGLTFAQDEEGNWGYIAPGADTVTPFKTGDGGFGIPLIGTTPTDVAGTLWFEADSGETISSDAPEGAYILSSIAQDENNTIWCDDGIQLTIKAMIPTADTGEIGCFWLE